VRLPDESLQFDNADQHTAVLRVNDQLLFDRFQAFGPGNVPTHVTFNTTYQRQPRSPVIVSPQTNDPTNPNNWAGTIWPATARGTFTAQYDDGTFSVTGTMDSALSTEGTPGHLGHMGHERNGIFAVGRQQGAQALHAWRHVHHAQPGLRLKIVRAY
jgi:hypothetical protein